ncbi:MAG: integrin alpha [Pseudomonadota bacterium]
MAHTNPFPTAVELGTLDGTDGFALLGDIAGDLSGFSVSSAGDVNGDGIDDIIVGAFAADPDGRGDAGVSYVVYGDTAGFGASLNLGALDGTDGFTLLGASTGDLSGFSVAAGGDVNGDGVDDLLVGAHRAKPGGRSDAGAS